MLYDWFATEISSISVQKIRLLPGNDARWDGWKQQARTSASSTAKHSHKIWVWTAQCLQESCDCDIVWKTKLLKKNEGFRSRVRSDSGRVEQQSLILVLKSQNAEKLHHSGFLRANIETELYFKAITNPFILTWKTVAKLKKICKPYKMFFDGRDPNSFESFFWILAKNLNWLFLLEPYGLYSMFILME